MLTDKQLLHRQYLESDVWKKKRSEALAFYGTICGRCGEFGSDVHHKSYAHVGGGELIEELEVLCRNCHEAHHRLELATHGRKLKKQRNGINKSALINYLTPRHRLQLQSQFALPWGEIYTKILCDDRSITSAALKMLGKRFVYPTRKKGRIIRPSRKPIFI